MTFTTIVSLHLCREVVSSCCRSSEHRKRAVFLTLFAEQTFRKISGQPIFYTQNKFLSILSDSPVTREAHSTLHNASRCQPDCWQSNLNVLFPEKTWERPGKPLFSCFFPNLHLLSYLVLRRQNVLDVRLPEVRTILDPTIFFWARFEGQNLLHVADAWHSPVSS